MMLTVMMSMAFAVKEAGPSSENGLTNPGTQHLYLYEKDADWNIVEGGAYGKLNFKENSYVFNAKGLEPNTEYTLINYVDPWGSPVACLGNDISTKKGGLHLKGEDVGTGKIWLVLSDDVDCVSNQMVGWNPEEYLFEYNLV